MIELTNKRFGRLRVIKMAYRTKTYRRLVWECICNCGNIIYVEGRNLRNSATQSCGCLHREVVRKAMTTHGKTSHSLFRTWVRLKQRCYNPRSKDYKNYGARGIKVCDRWQESFDNFLSDMGDKPKDFTIERVNNDGDYTPENCKWASRTEQNRNKRNIKLTKEKVIQIRELAKTGLPARKIAPLFGVQASTIFGVVSGETWKGI